MTTSVMRPAAKKALISHVKLSKHIQAWQIRRENLKIVVDSGVVAASTDDVEHE